MDKKVYVLTQTDTSDPTWCYNEVYGAREDAIERMMEMYGEDILEREDVIVMESSCDPENGRAFGRIFGEMEDDIILAWNVQEHTLLER